MSEKDRSQMKTGMNGISRRELLRGASAAVALGGMAKLPFAEPAPGGAATPSAAGEPAEKSSTFPDKFLWGCATAAYQVEGNNTNTDLWAMEYLPQSMFKEPSG